MSRNLLKYPFFRSDYMKTVPSDEPVTFGSQMTGIQTPSKMKTPNKKVLSNFSFELGLVLGLGRWFWWVWITVRVEVDGVVRGSFSFLVCLAEAFECRGARKDRSQEVTRS